jgi:hypothetical protein
MNAQYNSGALLFFKLYRIIEGKSVLRKKCVFCLTTLLRNAVRSGGYIESYARVTFHKCVKMCQDQPVKCPLFFTDFNQNLNR